MSVNSSAIQVFEIFLIGHLAPWVLSMKHLCYSVMAEIVESGKVVRSDLIFHTGIDSLQTGKGRRDLSQLLKRSLYLQLLFY